jgi:hypothetical protein
MKKTMLMLVVGMLFSFAAFGENRSTVRAEIPFAFQAGNRTMPAGSYRFAVEGGMNNRVVIENRQTRRQVVVQGLPTDRQARVTRDSAVMDIDQRNNRSEGSMLVFDQTGDVPRLYTVWGVGTADGVKIVPTRGALSEGNLSKSFSEQIASVARSH